MSKKDQTSPAQQPSLSLQEFKAAVDVLRSLLRAGSFLQFVSRPNVVRFIGEEDVFATEFSKKLQGLATTIPDARTTIAEIRRILQARIIASSTKRTVELLTELDEGSRTTEATPKKDELRRLLSDKTEYVASHLLNDSISRRVERLTTGTGPVLQDLDAELVAEAQENFQGATTNQPFLRLRVRYSHASATEFPFFFYNALSEQRGPTPRTFDIECDETDIDLLIRRLRSAKDLLLNAVAKRSEPKPAGIEDNESEK